MKKRYLFLLLLIPFQSFSQEFKLFTATSKKLFTDYPVPKNTYSLSIESARQTGTDSVYYNFFKVSYDWFESDTCWFWGGPECNRQNAPVWAGPKINYDNLETYTFYNLNNDSLFFYFNTEIDGPALFYYDSIQEFLIMYAATDTITVFGNPDTAQYFTILHTDHEGNPIDSPLNGQSIIISKEFGLVRFFVIDSFPSVLKPLSLIGNVTPTAGFYQLTNEMVYDYQPGDEIQYRETSWYQPPAPPWYYYTRYRKHIFLEREQTADSLKYLIRRELFYEDSVGIVIDTITKKHLRSKVIAQIPFEKFDGSIRRLYLSDYCGQSRWTYSSKPIEDTEFCEADTCWGVKDLGRPPDYLYTSFVMGLGLHTDIQSMPYEDGYTIRKRITYFKKNGAACGTQSFVGVNEYAKLRTQITLRPNPANAFVQISSSVEMRQFMLSDLYGNTLMMQSVSGKELSVDASQLSDGLYFVVVLLDNGKTVTKKLVVFRK